MNQSYVIATSTKVDVSKVDVGKFEDKYFKATEKTTSSKGESEFFESEPEKKVSMKRIPSSCKQVTDRPFDWPAESMKDTDICLMAVES